MKIAKRRATYPAISLPAGLDAIVDAEVQDKGYSNHPEAMKEFSAYLRRAVAFEQRQRFGR